jgi:GntR family transcriptional repressor for pyruvate dehydrogenase complex
MSDPSDRDPAGAARGGLTTIVRTQRSELVRRQLEDAIHSGAYKPGDRLPSERELVATFGVSRVSVRDAISSLEAVGLVVVQQGRGAFVNDRRSGLGSPMARWLELHRDEWLELHRVRGALDELAAQSAAERHEPSEVEKIVSLHERLAAAVDSGAPVDRLVPLDIDLHLAIAGAGGNRLLYDLLQDLHLYLAESRRFSLSTDGRPAESVREHAELVEAIRQGDGPAAGLAARHHAQSIRELVVAASVPGAGDDA